jgi:hypothetical protein
MFIPKNWGYELVIENNKNYCGKHLHIVANKKCSVHYHKIKKETFYIIYGDLLLEYSNSLDKNYWENSSVNYKLLNKGDYFTIDPMVAHRFSSANSFACDFIEISTHHDDSDSYRIIPSE